MHRMFRFAALRRHAHRGALIALAILACSRAGAQDFAARVAHYVQQRAPAPFNGVILVANSSGVVLHQAYGVAGADLGVALRPDHLFGIGSLTKPITAAAVMRLVERGALRLTDSVCNFLTPCPAAWRSVTLAHVLGHTSGIPDYFGELPAAPVDSTRAIIDRAAQRHLQDSLLSAPGTHYRYSNFNYVLVGYAMEVATGQRWESVLRAEILGPAGMEDTRYDDVWAIIPGRVRGYTMESGTLRHIRYRDHSAYAAGGLLSSASDLLRFDRALTGGALMSDSSFRRMTTPGYGEYGLGWQITRQFGRTVRNHTGGTNGFASHLATYDDGLTIIVLSNVESEAAKATACDIAALYHGLRLSERGAGQPACRRDA
ncbi:MAG: serine hydrolase domain-containing protein [Gemmatimonadaceae bacterium]